MGNIGECTVDGKALDVHYRMSDETAVSYEQLNGALFKRYNLTENGYRDKFRKCKPEPGENPDQFIDRLRGYLNKWVELSKTADSATGIKDLIINEQFTNVCPRDLAYGE